MDEQGLIYLQTGLGARQLLPLALLSPTQASAILGAVLSGPRWLFSLRPVIARWR